MESTLKKHQNTLKILSKTHRVLQIKSFYQTLKSLLFLMDLTLMSENNKNLNVTHTTASSPQKRQLSGELIRWELREESLTCFSVGGKLTLAIMNRAGRDIWMSSLPPETLPIWHCVIIMSGKSHELQGVLSQGKQHRVIKHLWSKKEKKMNKRMKDFFFFKLPRKSFQMLPF